MPVDTSRPPSWSLADALLRMIWESREISRAELARQAGLSRSTVSEAVSLLLETPLVSEAGAGESRGGRRPIVLAFQDDAFSVLGVDMGATHISVVQTDLRGRVLATESVSFPAREDPVGARRRIIELAERCRASTVGLCGPLLGVGIAVPSPVDPHYPDRVSPIAMPAWRGQHGLDVVGEHFGVPVRVDNDATLGALAEHWWGAARGLDDFAFVKIATGVGSGHFIRGEAYRGANGVAGEIGHLTIDSNGPPCNCGNRGCLVTYIGTTALERRTAELRMRFPRTSLPTGPFVTSRFVDAALRNDLLARQLVEEVAHHLGIAIASLLNLMNPQAVVFGGGLAALGELLLQPVRETVSRRTFASAIDGSRIMVSALEPRGIALGAATLMLDAALHDPSLFPALSHA